MDDIDKRIVAFAEEAARAVKSDRVRISALETQSEANRAAIVQADGRSLVNKKRISNLEALLAGEVYTEAKDSTVAYTKLVGDEAVTGGAEVMPYAGLETIGGKTLVWNQQWRTTSNKRVYTDASASDFRDFYVHFNENLHPPVSGHKYLVRLLLECSGFDNVVSSSVGLYLNMPVSTVTDSNVTLENLVTALKGEKKAFYWLGTLEGNLTHKGQDFCYLRFWNSENFVGTISSVANCFDLTLMFGAGNEPATVEEFAAMFPAEFYDYDAGTLKSAAVTEVVSSDPEGVTLGSLTIPAAVQALEGYGWSAGTAKNWIDWENKVYHREVGQRVCTAGSDVSNISNEANGVYRYVINLPGFICTPDVLAKETRILCSHFVSVSRNDTHLGTIGISGYTPTSSNCYICNGMTTLSEFREWVEKQYAAGAPLTINYALAKPELIDISDLLTDDNLISVQEGGVLTFKNALGADFCIPVPSDVAYTLKLVSKEETA